MYTTTIPSQNSSQSFQSGIQAYPIGMHSSMYGNTFTYSFNPSMSGSSSTLGFNPGWSQGFSSPSVSSSHINPGFYSTSMHPQAQSFQQSQQQLFQQQQSWQQAWQQAQAMQSGAFSYRPGQSSSALNQLQVDLAETNSDVVVAAALPNVNVSDITLRVTDDSMSISATAWTGGGSSFVYRSVALPTTIKSDQVDASFNNGILEIRAPKSDVVSRQKIKINAQ